MGERCFCVRAMHKYTAQQILLLMFCKYESDTCSCGVILLGHIAGCSSIFAGDACRPALCLEAMNGLWVLRRSFYCGQQILPPISNR